MPEAKVQESILIGVLACEPIRDAGLASIFDLPEEEGKPRLVPLVGTMNDLLAMPEIEYLVVDLHSPDGHREAIQTIKHRRPEVRLIVIGPEGDDEAVLAAIISGARAYLDLTAGPEIIRAAIEIVTSGSIWAPRRLLSKLIDRLLKVPKVTTTAPISPLTQREQQVLELIMGAHSTREIADRLGIEQRTVKAYVGRLMRKTGVDNRVKLTMSPLSRALVGSESGDERFLPGDYR